MTPLRIPGIWLILTCGVVGIAHLINPGYQLQRDYKKIVPRPMVAPSTQFKELNSSCAAEAQFLNSPQRQGVAPQDHRPRPKVEIIHHQKPFNIDIHTAAKSSPVADSTGVYVGSESGWFWKLSHEGEVLWSLFLPGSGNGIHGTAAVDDKKVYIGAYNGFLYALDKSNGEMVWANPVGNYIGSSPLLADGSVFIAAETYHPDGYVARLDCNTGETQWLSQWFEGHSHSSPAYDKDNHQILAGANSGHFFALDAQTGKTNWKTSVMGPIKGSPMVWKDKVYFSSWDKHFHAYTLKTGKEVWKKFMGGRIQTTMTLVPSQKLGLTNNKVGDIAALDLETGEFQWRLRHGDPSTQFGILITQDPDNPKREFAWSRCKMTALCVVDTANGHLIHRVDLPGSFTSTPHTYKDKIYISLDKGDGFIILQ